MKANEAPEKLYVDTEDRLSGSILYGFTEKHKNDAIEYIRKDAFIEKACEFLNKYISEIEQYEPAIMDYKVIDVHCKHHDSKEDFIRDFKKYIKEE